MYVPARIKAVAALTVCLIGYAGLVSAGTISMQVQCGVQGDSLRISIVNLGDEPARNVTVQADFMDQQFSTPRLEALEPGHPMGSMFSLASHEQRGTFPAVVRVKFEDLNGYPFSSVSVQPVVSGELSPSALSAVLVPGNRMKDTTLLRLRIRSDAKMDTRARIRTIVPEDLTAQRPDFQLVVPAGQVVSEALELSKFSALAGSSHPVHVLVEYDRDGTHFCEVAGTAVKVVGGPAWLQLRFWIIAAVVLILAAGSCVVARLNRS